MRGRGVAGLAVASPAGSVRVATASVYNRYRAMRMEMTNKQNGRKSVFESEKIALAPDTKDEFFTPRYLERQ